ncbi:MAG TPA: hypothetical protein VMM12_12725 [Longimicrobiales bacterium]|nr:hypothetical protein [Longimicrobiales bacterium]
MGGSSIFGQYPTAPIAGTGLRAGQRSVCMVFPRCTMISGIPRRAALALLFLFAAGACDERPLDPAADPAFSSHGGPTVTLDFGVHDSQQPVLGAAVWLYNANGLVGIFNDGADLDGLNNGRIKISVPAGQYGAMIKKIPVETQTLAVVAPVPSLPSITAILGTPFAPLAIGGSGTWGCADGPTVASTTVDLPIKAKGKGFTTNVDIGSCAFSLLTVEVTGATAGDPLYGVIGTGGQAILGLGDLNGFERGILGFVAIVEAQSGALFAELVCPVGVNFAVELFQTANVGGAEVNRVASLLQTCGSQDASATIVTEAAQCALESDPSVDATFGASTWGYGFHRGNLAAGQPAKLIDLATATARFSVMKDGAYTVIFRTDLLTGGRYQSEANFKCGGGQCTAGSTKTTGGGNPTVIGLFFAPGAGGSVIVEAVLAGIPAHAALTWSVKGPGGVARPVASKSPFSAAYYLFRQVPTNTSGNPLDCTQDSNDGTWSVRDL